MLSRQTQEGSTQELETLLKPWPHPGLLWGPRTPAAQITVICEHLLEAFFSHEMLLAHLRPPSPLPEGTGQ